MIIGQIVVAHIRMYFNSQIASRIQVCWMNNQSQTHPKRSETLYNDGWLLGNILFIINHIMAFNIAKFVTEKRTRRYPSPHTKLSRRSLSKVVDTHHRQQPPSHCIRKRLVYWCWVWASAIHPSMAKRVKNHLISTVPPGCGIGVMGVWHNPNPNTPGTNRHPLPFDCCVNVFDWQRRPWVKARRSIPWIWVQRM